MLKALSYTCGLSFVSPAAGLPSSVRISFRRESQTSTVKDLVLLSDSMEEPTELLCTAHAVRIRL